MFLTYQIFNSKFEYSFKDLSHLSHVQHIIGFVDIIKGLFIWK